jgi:hypothetical protein
LTVFIAAVPRLDMRLLFAEGSTTVPRLMNGGDHFS